MVLVRVGVLVVVEVKVGVIVRLGNVVAVKVEVDVNVWVMVGVAVGGALLTEMVVINALTLKIKTEITITKKTTSAFFIYFI